MQENAREEPKGFETDAIHGEEGEDPYRALTPPIYMTSTYTFPSMEEVDRVLRGEAPGYVYSRAGNPTVWIFEQTMARLEEGEEAVAFASGMGAISAVLLSWLKKKKPLVFSKHLYSGTRHFVESMLIPLGAEIRWVDFREGTDFRTRLSTLVQDGVSGVFLETPSNPTLDIVDLLAVSGIAGEFGVPLAVDNTFASPALQRPLRWGADIVLHSATKYLGGHGDLLGGVAIGSRETIRSLRTQEASLLGATLSPMNAWLILRGLKTLGLRMEAHSRSATLLAGILSNSPAVQKVLYPGLPDHPGHLVASRQMRAMGGMLSVVFPTGEAARRFMDRLRIIKIGVSLGDPASLVEHPATMSHRGWAPEIRRAMGVEDGLVRMSVGLETPEDLASDIAQALGPLS